MHLVPWTGIVLLHTQALIGTLEKLSSPSCWEKAKLSSVQFHKKNVVEL